MCVWWCVTWRARHVRAWPTPWSASRRATGAEAGVREELAAQLELLALLPMLRLVRAWFRVRRPRLLAMALRLLLRRLLLEQLMHLLQLQRQNHQRLGGVTQPEPHPCPRPHSQQPPWPPQPRPPASPAAARASPAARPVAPRPA